MKRVGNVYEQICSMENLYLADEKARKGKKKQKAIRRHDLNREANLQRLREMLINKRYKSSEYYVFKVYEPKEREVYRAEYYPDRITHHAVLNVIEKDFSAVFTADTYSSIKRRGIHGMAKKVRRALNDVPGTKYCLKLDIKKFYPNIDHEILKGLLRRKFKDKDLLWLLDEIIDSAPGVPIGNYLSQYFANFYLTYFDHWLKEVKGVKYYFRYADDIVVFGDNKADLHKLLAEIKQYLWDNLKLVVKGNYQVFPVEARGVDVVGYVFRHGYTLIRKRTKRRYARMLKRNCNPQSIAAYNGMLKHCNSTNLRKKLQPMATSFKDLKIENDYKGFVGEKKKMYQIINRPITVIDFAIKPSTIKAGEMCLHLQFEMDGVKYVTFPGSKPLMNVIEKIPKDNFPFTTTIVKDKGWYEFT